MKEWVGNLVLKGLGLLLLTAAVLKGHELLTTPVANTDIWTNRWFLILQVEFELALGIWLLSGLIKRAAWLAAIACFALFSAVTLYKGVTGAASCGCFGNVHVNPWITLFAIDLPAVILLSIFRPKLEAHRVFSPLHWLQPRPNPLAFGLIFVIGLAAVAVSAPLLVLNEPPKVTANYEILEPETWIGKELPILEHIDIADQLKEGNWLIVLYHHDCPDCIAAIPQIEQMARDLKGNEDFLRIALIAVPPYGTDTTSDVISVDSSCIFGRLDTSKNWFVTTPTITIVQEGNAYYFWEKNVPLIEEIVIQKSNLSFKKTLSLIRK